MSRTTEEHTPESNYAIELLRNQVDELQIAAAEKKKPWYRQTPSLASLLALLLSITTAVYSAVQGHRQDIQKKQETLRGITAALIDLAADYQAKLASADAQKLSTQDREFLGGMTNNKRLILVEAADNLVRDIPNYVSSSEYNILANDKLNSGGSAKAEEYLRKGVDVSEEPIAKMMALRNLAMFYAQRGPFHNMAEARKRFQQSTEALDGEPRDDASAYVLGFTWEMWGTAEFLNNFPGEAQPKIANARKYYAQLSSDNPLRQSAPAFLDARLRRFTSTTGSAAETVAPVSGDSSALPVPPVTLPFPSQSPGSLDQ